MYGPAYRIWDEPADSKSWTSITLHSNSCRAGASEGYLCEIVVAQKPGQFSAKMLEEKANI